MNFICVLMVVVLLLFCIPGNTFAQVVDIPDTNLRSAITETLGKTIESLITVLEMESLKGLSANDRGISDLTGLEAASHLTWLTLRDNNISDLSPLANPQKTDVVDSFR